MKILAGPDLVSRGFVYVREAEDLLEEASALVRAAAERALAVKGADWNLIKTEIRDTLGEFVWRKTKRRPMLLPILMEVEQ